MITGALKSLFALSEAYPDLKANQNFLSLQEELTGTEGRIAYARQFYNDTVYKLQHQDPDASRPTSSPSMFALHASASTSRPTTSRAAPSRSSSDGAALTAVLSCTTRSPPTSAVAALLDRRLRRRSSRSVAPRFAYLLGGGLVGVVVARRHRRRRQRSSPTGSPTRSRCAMSRARPAPVEEYARYHNLVEGLCIAVGLPKPRLYVDRRPGAQRLRHRPQPPARGDRGHHRPAREDEPRRARGRARPRAVATSRTTTSSCRPWP